MVGMCECPRQGLAATGDGTSFSIPRTSNTELAAQVRGRGNAQQLNPPDLRSVGGVLCAALRWRTLPYDASTWSAPGSMKAWQAKTTTAETRGAPSAQPPLLVLSPGLALATSSSALTIDIDASTMGGFPQWNSRKNSATCLFWFV
jgi:hypothetical protein